MTSQASLAREQRTIEQIAEEYRSKGYDVLVEPSGSDLPPFLGDQHPDLIARRGEEQLVIELRLPSRDEPGRLRRLAERIFNEPDWKLILIVPGPTEEFLPGERLTLLSAPEIEQYLEQTRQLLGSGDQEAAILLAWAAVEGLLRDLAQREEIPLPRPETPTLLKQMIFMGIVDHDQYRALTEAYKARTAVAHGFKAQTELEPAIQALLKLSDELREPQPAD
jgi:REase_AHJR-like protein